MNRTNDVAGVWNREWEEDPLGAGVDGRDVTTLVWWIQSKVGVYVDLRLSLQNPGRIEVPRNELQANPLALTAGRVSDQLYDYAIRGNPAVLDLLLDQKSFAGLLEITQGDTTESGEALNEDQELAQGNGDLCTCLWNRHIDFQPPTGGLDLGVCRREPAESDGSVFMRETGHDGSYAEGWRKYGGGTEPHRSLVLAAENGKEGVRKGFWVRVGSRFGYAIGRPLSEDASTVLGCHGYGCHVAQAVGKSLKDSLESLSPREKLDVAMSYVVVAGTVDDAGNCNISYSTNPELVGTMLPEGTESDGGKTVTQRIGSTVRLWNILE